MTLTVSGESPGLSRPVCSGEAGTSQEQQGRQDEEGFFLVTPKYLGQIRKIPSTTPHPSKSSRQLIHPDSIKQCQTHLQCTLGILQGINAALKSRCPNQDTVCVSLSAPSLTLVVLKQFAPMLHGHAVSKQPSQLTLGR